MVGLEQPQIAKKLDGIAQALLGMEQDCLAPQFAIAAP